MPFVNNFVDSWGGWDEVDTFTDQFYDAKIKNGVFENPPAPQANGMYVLVVDTEHGMVTLYGDTEGKSYQIISIGVSPIE